VPASPVLSASKVLPDRLAIKVWSERRARKALVWPVLPGIKVPRVLSAFEARSERPAPKVTWRWVLPARLDLLDLLAPKASPVKLALKAPVQSAQPVQLAQPVLPEHRASSEILAPKARRWSVLKAPLVLSAQPERKV
jgi:hypothetical protein